MGLDKGGQWKNWYLRAEGQRERERENESQVEGEMEEVIDGSGRGGYKYK